MSEPSTSHTAVLLMAHGSRRQNANDDLAKLAEIVRARGPYRLVEIGYLELAEPSIPAGAQACVEQGADTVLMLPYFLSAGRHVVGDLQRFRDELSARFPGVSFRLCPPLGLHPSMADIVLDRLKEGEADNADGREA
jgi:sirohydrochlorin ferrochelatase